MIWSLPLARVMKYTYLHNGVIAFPRGECRRAANVKLQNYKKQITNICCQEEEIVAARQHRGVELWRLAQEEEEQRHRQEEKIVAARQHQEAELRRLAQ